MLAERNAPLQVQSGLQVIKFTFYAYLTVTASKTMPAKDIYHDAVKNALIKDGWTIIADPYLLRYEDADLYADLFAEKTLFAVHEGRKIVVEIKSFINPSPMRDFENALGQYILYRDILELGNKDYELYLAVRDTIFNTFF